MESCTHITKAEPGYQNCTLCNRSIHFLPIYQALARAVEARANCIRSSNVDWQPRWEDRIKVLINAYMPSGSGWDTGTTLDLETSTPDKLVFYGSYHHMNDGGMYDGWTDHSITIRPSLTRGFDLRVTGRDRNDIKDYLAEMFDCALRLIVQE
jgi:hypothetical protein